MDILCECFYMLLILIKWGFYMTQYLIMCRSLTFAQRAQKQLESIGISALVVKAPQGLNTSGCGYAVSVHRRVDEAVAYLSGKGTISGKIFRRTDRGDYIEVKL